MNTSIKLAFEEKEILNKFTKFLSWDGSQNRLYSGLFLWLWGRPVEIKDSCNNFRVWVDLKGGDGHKVSK